MPSDSDYLGLTDFISPTHFFKFVSPQVLSARASGIQALGGRYGFRLLGEGGGQWLLDFPHASIQEGTLEDADVVFESDAGDFQALIADKLDVTEALSAGKIRITGDSTLLVNLKYAFLPA
jgi:hypothetical protein